MEYIASYDYNTRFLPSTSQYGLFSLATQLLPQYFGLDTLAQTYVVDYRPANHSFLLPPPSCPFPSPFVPPLLSYLNKYTSLSAIAYTKNIPNQWRRGWLRRQ